MRAQRKVCADRLHGAGHTDQHLGGQRRRFAGSRRRLLAALAQGTPGVSLKSEGPSQTEIEMRGMTSSGGNSATVGFYLDDIPLAGPASAQNGHVVIDPDLYDLNRIEILRGPQGTLFGSGSMGGTVRLITNQPN
jgi:iron complex outermembrane receptor protein